MAENPGILGDRGKSLEDEFFRKENARAIERLRELKERTTSRETLAKAIGITNEKIIDRLIELGIRPEIVSALAIVPLVEVAWADGSLDAKERQAVLERAEKSGIAPGTADHDLLHTAERKLPALVLAGDEAESPQDGVRAGLVCLAGHGISGPEGAQVLNY